jgi:hypothetical protein
LIYSAVPVLRVANVARSAPGMPPCWGSPVIRWVRQPIQALVPDVGAIVNREYGCRELALLDPDGHVVVLGECG